MPQTKFRQGAPKKELQTWTHSAHDLGKVIDVARLFSVAFFQHDTRKLRIRMECRSGKLQLLSEDVKER